jgi:hypothetical protein
VLWRSVWSWVMFCNFFSAKIILWEFSDKTLWSSPFKTIKIWLIDN